jgi:hypothetical protein
LAFASGAAAETITWNNPAGGVWNLAANWDPLDVPNEAGEEAVVADDGYTYTIDMGTNLTLDKITLLNPDLTLNVFDWDLNFYHEDGLTNHGTVVISGGDAVLYANQHNEAGGVFKVMDGGQLRKYGGTLTNNGTVYLNPDALATPAILYIWGSGALSGSGEMVMTTAGNADGAQINTYIATFYHGPGHTIRGDGQINAVMTNDGTIRADHPGTPLYMVTGAKTNNGIIEATNGAELYVSSGAITQGVDGIVQADNGTVTLYSPARINNGYLNTLNGGFIEARGPSIFSQVTNDGSVHVLDGQHLRIETEIVNNGQILVNSDLGGANAYLHAYNGALFDGTGEVLLQTAGDPDDAYINTYYTTMTNGENHTIRGGGRIHANMVNNGLIRADRPGDPLWLFTTAKTNNATMEAIDGGELVIGTGAITQGASGVIRADAAKVAFTTSAAITGGYLETVNGGEFECQAIASLTNVNSQAQINIPNGQGLEVHSGMINDGQILIHSDSGEGNSYFQFWNNPLLEGTGEILMRSEGDSEDATIHSYYCVGTQGPNHTIRGSGTIHGAMTNDGTIRADDPSVPLYLATSAKTNNGIMEATNAATLAITSGAITQGPSGVIRADNGTVALQSYASITGGTFASSNGGTIECQAVASVTSIDNQAQINILNGQGLQVHSGMINDGQILIHSDSGEGNSYFQFWNNPLLEGTGEILMRSEGDSEDATIHSYYAIGTQGPDHTIRGSGTIHGAITNNGTIRADDPNEPLHLATNTKTNNGVIEAVEGAELVLWNGIVTQGETGVFRADSAIVALSTSAKIIGGSLETVNTGIIECRDTATLRLVTNYGDVHIPSGLTLDCEVGITNHGRIIVNSDHGGSGTALRARDSNAAIEGTGEIILQAGADVNTAQLSGYYASLYQGPEHTIRGTGVITTTMTNDGLIIADQPHAKLETTTTFTNSGTVAAVDSGIVRVGQMNQHFSGGVMSGGTWYAGPGSTLRLIGANIVENDAEFTLDGLGSAVYSDDGTTDALANLQTIGAGGMLEIANGRDCATPGDLTVDRGGLIAGEGCAFTVNGQFTQTGNEEDPNLPGYTCVNGTFVATTDPVDIQGGTLCGSGTVQNTVNSSGRVNPGASAGELTITGDYTQTEEGTCWIELAGLNVGEYDHLQVNGDVILAGRLVVTSIEGYEPNVGDRFTIMSFASRAGEFTLETGSPGVGLIYETYYYTDHIEIEIHGDPSYVPEPEIADDTPANPGDEGESDPGLESDDPFNTPELIPTTLSLMARPQAGGGALLMLDLPQTAQVTLELFDLSGRRVAILQSGPEAAGRQTYTWSGMTQTGARAASGVYLARARVTDGGNTDVMQARLLLVR